MSVNKALLLGNLGQDPELHEGEKPWCRFSMATTDYKKETTWHDCVAFGKQAENIAKYCSKGSQLFVEGRIKKSTHEGKERVSVIVESFSFVGGAPKKEEKTETDPDLPF